MEEITVKHSDGEILFRNLIQKEFLKRRQNNNSYSMRSFALSLGINQSLLSKIVNARRRVSQKTILEIGPKIGLKPSEIKKCVDSRLAKNVSSNYSTLVDEEFELLSSWYHFAILELMKTDDFKSCAKFVSKRLNIPLSVAKDAVNRLDKLGFVNSASDNWVLLKNNNSWANNKSTSEARLIYQEQVVAESAKSIRDVEFDMRDHGSMTVAINSSRVPEFKEKLKEIRRELDSFFHPSEDGSYDEVYQLTIGLFPVSKNKEDYNEKE